jgi:hypothetical protein
LYNFSVTVDNKKKKGYGGLVTYFVGTDFLKVIEEALEGRRDVTERQGRRSKQLLDELTERRGCYNLTKEALDRTLCRTGFRREYGPLVKQMIEGNEYCHFYTYHFYVFKILTFRTF